MGFWKPTNQTAERITPLLHVCIILKLQQYIEYAWNDLIMQVHIRKHFHSQETMQAKFTLAINIPVSLWISLFIGPTTIERM